MLSSNAKNFGGCQIPFSDPRSCAIFGVSGTNLRALIEYSSDLISGDPLIVVCPLCMFAYDVQNFIHRVAAELEEPDKPKALEMGWSYCI